MPKFSNSCNVVNCKQKLSKNELVRAIRFNIAAEYEAIQLYQQVVESTDNEFVKTVLTSALDILRGLEKFDNDSLFAALSPLSERLGAKTGAIMWCVRIAVSGMSATPGGATEIMEVIGKEESISRIENALNLL